MCFRPAFEKLKRFLKSYLKKSQQIIASETSITQNKTCQAFLVTRGNFMAIQLFACLVVWQKSTADVSVSLIAG